MVMKRLFGLLDIGAQSIDFAFESIICVGIFGC